MASNSPPTFSRPSIAADQTDASLPGASEFSSSIGTSELPSTALVRHILFPLSATAALLASALLFGQPITRPYVILAVLTFALTWKLRGTTDIQELRPLAKVDLFLPQVFYGWTKVVGILLFLGFAAKVTDSYSRAVIIAWVLTTPILYWAAHTLAYRFLCRWNKRGCIARTHVIVGRNSHACELARRLEGDASLGTFIGFFDRDSTAPGLLGDLEALPEYVRRNAIDVIHIADPCAGDERIRRLLDALRDTTASIYFVLDAPGHDNYHPRVVDMAGMPLLAYLETPHFGLQAVTKRLVDIAITTLLLALLWPVMLAIAIAIRIDTKGPIVFRQRRYGLKGEEIPVYKFRTMTVCEDGASIAQATRNDPRITRVGQFLRRTSLDELPQLFCVLSGSMSLVGPRPHAVAHNEHYRRQIDGYMLRHKVRPGMTGWAQVNGARGETRTLEQMRRRVRYDLEYLRHWSPWIDLKILIRTALVVIRDRNAY